MVSEALSPHRPGNFHQRSLPSPAPTTSIVSLPHPRAQPLRPGSSKEETTRRYVEGKLLLVSRRYVKKFQPPQPDSDVQGYHTIRDICKDLSEIVGVLWLSGTPSLQIPYLLNIALAVTTYLSAFPPDPSPTFALLGKLDHTFASLLQGADIESGEALPGFAAGKRAGLSKTDMVRCKSLVETTRVQIVDIMSQERHVHDQTQSGTNNEDETDTYTDETSRGRESIPDDDDTESRNMEIARVYEMTIVQLGEALGNSTYDAATDD